MSRRDDILGPYRLTRQITRGNATYIWEAIRTGTAERYVIKVLDEKNRDNKEEVQQLRHEFEVAQKLEHPNIIRIFELGTTAPAYLVLEVFSMVNLKQALRQDRQRLLVDFARIADQAAGALAHLHSKGWVHCDVKPDNFLLNEEGIVKLIDFSIARRAATGLMGKLFGGQKVTRGTRSYMSPEQIRGKAVDARADVYSFGCVLYELLTGKLPFTGINPNELLTKHLTAPIPNVQVHNDNVTPEMAELLRNLMAKEVGDRPKSMDDVQKRLKMIRIFRMAPRPASPPPGDASAASS
ncbi:MAG: serine/threonine-protein kinase [Pirellulaceae bacterium]